MNSLYNLGVKAYSAAARVAAPFNPKARLWTDGRKGWREMVSSKISRGDRVLWVHCSSLGEFEQGRPVIEAVMRLRPGMRILLTFFSPSGYEIRKNYPHASCICYLPSDTPANASEFLRLAHPEAAIFVKYEFWNNYITQLHLKNIPLYLISGIFRPGQPFFRWYGSFFKKMLSKFEMIYLQDKNSEELLRSIGIDKTAVAGDTRFDRVVEITKAAKSIPAIESFAGGEKLFIAGSSWAPDEEIIARYINENPGRMKWIFAPHEVDVRNIDRLAGLLRVKSIRFSAYDGKPTGAQVMIIDNIGMLSSAYRYAHMAAVGGGFGKGIHNILEPACWGIPVLFGPRHEKFREAVELIKEKGAMTFNSYEEFKTIINNLLEDDAFYLKSAKSASLYVKKNTGATEIILAGLMSKI